MSQVLVFTVQFQEIIDTFISESFFQFSDIIEEQKLAEIYIQILIPDSDTVPNHDPERILVHRLIFGRIWAIFAKFHGMRKKLAKKIDFGKVEQIWAKLMEPENDLNSLWNICKTLTEMHNQIPGLKKSDRINHV